MNKSISKKLIAASDQGSVSSSHTPPSDFHRAALQLDPKDGVQIVGEQAGLEFDIKSGAELMRSKLDQEELDEQFKESRATRDKLTEQLKSTKQHIKSAAFHSDSEEHSAIGFSQWRRQDQVLIALTCISLIIAMFMGAANIFTNLMASGEPVFIENPTLAMCLSALAPLGAMALKFVSSSFEYYQSKKRYTTFINVLTALSLLVWSILFSLSFTGVASSINFETLDEETGTGSLLVWIQIVAEILVASALFLAAEDIYIKYAPDTYVENLEHINISRALKAHMIKHERLRDERNANHGSIVQLEAERQAFINERIAEYLAHRARFNSINKF